MSNLPEQFWIEITEITIPKKMVDVCNFSGMCEPGSSWAGDFFQSGFFFKCLQGIGPFTPESSCSKNSPCWSAPSTSVYPNACRTPSPTIELFRNLPTEVTTGTVPHSWVFSWSLDNEGNSIMWVGNKSTNDEFPADNWEWQLTGKFTDKDYPKAAARCQKCSSFSGTLSLKVSQTKPEHLPDVKTLVHIIPPPQPSPPHPHPQPPGTPSSPPGTPSPHSSKPVNVWIIVAIIAGVIFACALGFMYFKHG